MNSYSCLDDIGVERVFEEIKQENAKECDWTTYSNLAVAYVKSGHNEKAVLALKKLEEEMGPRNRGAYHYLISLHSRMSNLGEVYRIWNSLKHFLETTNTSYLVMLQSLSKLNDIDGLKKCYEEWKSNCSTYDMRLANNVIVHGSKCLSLEYFVEERDVGGAEEFYKFLKLNCLNSDVYSSLLRTYVAANKTADDMILRIKEDELK
ncbi:hypothetical protein K7X08_008403 [Anisodus acutangulus]|uniref:Pentatricopeptide repeat-containing protein n=1 Tax=Anisodus acutangulus TaxID=402998 RepID=A0A9Q1MQ86_9SOLA|nr:hypothetical protein K7X08_008403 [Anisodus acutangulus]